jgi:1-acyl-sn-glycerol-3-phosphate acyltransferase
MAQDYSVPRRNRAARKFLRPTFRGLFHILSSISIHGLENVPHQGPYMIAINHISLYEAPFVVAFWPQEPEAVGASDVWNRAGQSTLVRWYGGIPVHRGEYDRRLVDTMLKVLRAGKPLLIAPEGGRSHTPGLRRAFPGVAYVMDKASVPVVPVGVIGSTDDFLRRALRGERPPLVMNIGKPIQLSRVSGDIEAKRRARQQNADLVMAHIAALLPDDYRGVYADHPITAGIISGELRN